MYKLKLNNPKVMASLSAGMAVAFVPQYSQAGLVTVGGDGGTGSVTLNNGDTTNLGGGLSRSLQAIMKTSGGFLRDPTIAGRQQLFPAVRSSLSASGSGLGGNWTFNSLSAPAEGAVWNSTDNWIPGFFNVTGINGGNQIYGWLQVGLSGASFPTQVEIISFTYDDAATDTTKFAKPVGGFQVSAVPEPSTLGLAALALGAAGVVRRRRYLKPRATV